MDNIDLENDIPDEVNENEENMNNINIESDNKPKICLDLFNIF